MKTIQEKCELLAEEYKDVDPDALEQLLLVCEGSVAKTRVLLDESFERTNSANRSAQYQSTITSMFGPSNKKRKKNPATPQVYGSPKSSNNKTKTKIVLIYDESQVLEHLHPYVSVHRNFLPQKLSNSVLTYLMDNRKMFTPSEFYMFERWCKSNHDLGFLHIPDRFDHKNAYYNGVKGQAHTFDDVLYSSSSLIEDYINAEIIPNYEKLPFQQPKYQVSACVVNHYSQLSNNLDWHSDRLQGMGPHNFVASLSLGCTREFRLRRHSLPNIIYSVPLPHNTLLLMHPGCQELFKHCVNPMKKPLQLHPLCGPTRFNVTFRYFPKEFTENTPKCKCNIPMCLRRSYKRPDDPNFGKYHWTCENSYQNKDCKTFHWADFDNVKNHYISESDDSVSTWTCQ